MSTNNDILAMLFRVDPETIKGVTIVRASDSPRDPWVILRGVYFHGVSSSNSEYKKYHYTARLGLDPWDVKRLNLIQCYECINIWLRKKSLLDEPLVRLAGEICWILSRCKEQSGQTPMRFRIIDV